MFCSDRVLNPSGSLITRAMILEQGFGCLELFRVPYTIHESDCQYSEVSILRKVFFSCLVTHFFLNFTV